MKKLIIIILFLLILSSCKQTDQIKMIVPYGSTQYAQLYMQDNNDYLVDIIQGPDSLVAAFTTNEYDVIFAPTNLGALMFLSKDNYQLLGVITWGNFYLITVSDSDFNLSFINNKEIILFGQNQTSDIILKYVLSNNDIVSSLSYLDSVMSVQSEFILNQNKIYMVAEPIYSNLLHLYPNIKSIDLQDEYKKLSNKDSYPQAGIFIKKDLDSKTINKIKNDLSYSVNQIEEDLLKTANLATKLGFNITLNVLMDSITNSNIKFVLANDAKEDIVNYFNLILSMNPNLIGGMLPGDDFYH